MRGLALPPGVRLVELETVADAATVRTEVFREDWGSGLLPVEWRALRSEGNALRGVHVHVREGRYLTLIHGRAALGLADLRPEAGFDGLPQSCLLELRDDVPTGVLIPPGVAHGMLFRSPAVLLEASSHHFTAEGLVRCRWDDHALRIPWPARTDPVLSRADAAAPPLAAVRYLVAPRAA